MNKLVLIRGLPGSGKSTLAKTLVGYTHFEKDQYFTDLWGNYNFNSALESFAYFGCLNATFKHLQEGEFVVVSNVFPTKKTLKPYLKIAKHFGTTPVIITLKTQFGSVHNIPEETMQKLRATFQELPESPEYRLINNIKDLEMS